MALCSLAVGCGETDEPEQAFEVTSGRNAVSADIGQRGGALELESRARITLPPGALDESIELRSEVRDLDRLPARPTGFEEIGEAIVVTPHGLKLGKPATVELTIDDLDSPKKDMRVLRLSDDDDRRWEEIGDLRLLAVNESGRLADEFDGQSGDDGVGETRRLEIDVNTFSIFLPVRVTQVEGECVGKSRGDVCRAAAGDCDVAETCDGQSPTCPEDDLAKAGNECRASSGLCDVAETCDGESAECPEDGVRAADSVCRPARGDCDVAETCNGQTADCPDNSFADADVECRAADGDCDVAENCSGESADCPSNLFDSETVCRPVAGVCDAAEACDGAGPDCPTDLFVTGTSCGQAADCMAAPVCDGGGSACPAALPAPAGTACDDTLYCTVTDACDGAGSCTGTGDPCTGGIGCSTGCDEGRDLCTGQANDGTACLPTACSIGECTSGVCGETVPCPVYVSSTTGIDAPTCGANWGNACQTVQYASDIAVGASNPRLFVQAGSYPHTGLVDDAVLSMSSGIEYYGGFVGTENTPGERTLPPASYSALDGLSVATHVVTGTDNARLDGFEVTRGIGAQGAGLYNVGVTNLTIANTRFVENHATGATVSGAGVFNASSSVTMTDVMFQSNSLSASQRAHGGGMFSDDSTLSLTNVSFVLNSVSAGATAVGGGMYDSDTDSDMGEVVFQQNDAVCAGDDPQGGGYAVFATTPHTSDLANVTFVMNTAQGNNFGTGSQGGGMKVNGPDTASPAMNLTDVLFLSNIAGSPGNNASGGGMAARGGDLTLANVSFVDNLATGSQYGTGEGGGLFVANAAASLAGVQFVDNTAAGQGSEGGGYAYGGGLFSDTTTLEVVDSDFIGNIGHRELFGAGAGLYHSGANSLTVTNTGFVGNVLTGSGSGQVNAASVDGTGGYTFTHVSFVGNSAPGSTAGVGLQIINGAGSVRNSVFTGSGGTDIEAMLSTTLTADSVCSEDIVGTNHTLASFADAMWTQSRHPVLASTSNCFDSADLAVADATYGTDSWSSLYTEADGTLDAPAPDPGRHYDANALHILDFSGPPGDSVVAWLVRVPAGTRCAINGPGYNYNIPEGDLPSGSVDTGITDPAVELQCARGGVMTTATLQSVEFEPPI